MENNEHQENQQEPAIVEPAGEAVPETKVGKTRKPRADKGKPRGSKGVASKSSKHGRKSPKGLYYILNALDDKTPSATYELKAFKLRDALREIMANASRPDCAESHLGRRCRVVAILDEFKLVGETKTKVMAER